MTTDTMVQVRDVWRRFGRHEALRGLNLTVPEGGAYALIGTNGAGKTTTIKVLMNLLQPTRGTALVMGADSRTLAPEIRAQIGYVSENQALPGRLSVGEYLSYLRPFYPTWDNALEKTLCDRLQLPADRKINALSHGMRLKLALACALPYRPRLLVLDEPFSGLDPLVREEIMEGLLSQAGDFTLLIASQELAEIESLTTHAGFVHEGRMLLEESMDELRRRLREVRVTLERPAAVPDGLPSEWLQPRAFGNVFTFVDTRHDASTLDERLRVLLGPVKQIDSEPMALNAVFKALARGARAGAMQ